jgi:hypothetical protein
VVVAKYGAECVGNKNLGSRQVYRIESKWWRDICALDKDSNWFMEAVEKRVGDGKSILFWSEVWIGNQSLQDRFPGIFGVSNKKTHSIFSIGVWNDGAWEWVFDWRKNLFAWEIPIFADFRDVINNFVSSAEADKWLLCVNRDNGFSVKNCYYLLYHHLSVPRILDRCDEFVFVNLWKSEAPSKACAFAWQLLLDRIQTRENLRNRRILQHQQLNCAL